MKSPGTFFLALARVVLSPAADAAAQESVIYSFGTTDHGGDEGWGAVYQIVP